MNNEEIITIPNFITLFRIVCIPFFILSLVYNKDAWAVLIFAAMSLSDALDGISARLTNQKTKIGALLDTTADNLVVFSTLLTFTIIRGMIPFYITIALFVAFILCALAKIIYVKKGNSTNPTIMGKLAIAFAYLTGIAYLIDFQYKLVFSLILVFFAYATVATYLAKDIRLLKK
ncbi:MAG TPA: CDP-alcohol phosphatidyltransferase family protein [Candidatus Nanoarchaeia archaeon]|nr:CDP-alcohol phosphatidyltransferase family protein [Candidatus Nanoarchaeia archaeon]